MNKVPPPPLQKKYVSTLPDFKRGELVKKTTSICPGCLQYIEAEVFRRNRQIWMDKTCQKCGPFSALLSSDANEYLIKVPDSQQASSCGCGSGGCGSAIDNHSCVLLVEITQKCNLTCPTCYASSSPQNDHFLSLKEYDALLDKLLANQHGDADALQLSGGEPTIHPDILPMIELAYEKGFKQVYINTNGIKLSNDTFAKSLAKLGKPLSIYLQFDGTTPDVYAKLRGNEKLVEVKARALENCAKHGFEAIPVMTLTRGVNDNQISEFIRVASQSPAVNKAMIQPAMYSGRYVNPRRVDRITASDTIGLIAEQSGIFSRADFTPIPCGDPNCFRMALALRSDDGLIPVSRFFPPYEKWASPEISEGISAVSDTFDDPDALQRALALASESEALAQLPEEELDQLIDLISGSENSENENSWGRLFAIGIKPFMDAYTYDQDRIDTCCTHITARDGTPVSFCQYNALNRPQGNL
ncbi:radical SAM protein [Pelagicoccus mobilis]|uniref:Radical SAM protein n=1 Tax=Pelagicoccus mobilis TaxID=415221 RepID=A0A934S5F8_9BACT|nr:radical SAM protein [Pelagicoccus mobilis]MBK1880107.1 radical SAM protein [Pelagicoccus mobilis]